MALLAQKAENGWVGVNCGIMDQMICATAEAGHAILLDCRSLETRAVPLPPGMAVVVLDTGTRRGLVDSQYNERRAQCESTAKIMGVSALRDVGLEELEKARSTLNPVAYRRAYHVIAENSRTECAAEAMVEGDAPALGEMMDASHLSLRDDFEVSSDSLNKMVEIARMERGCLGARMTGAGFGGCAVALVREQGVYEWMGRVERAYREHTGHKPALYTCRPSQGAHVV